MKILITGMNGFVGAAITKALFNSEHELIGLVRDRNLLPDEIIEKYKIVQADISKKVPKIDCDLVIHTAATVSDKVLSVIMNKTNVEGTRRVLEATGDAPFIYISSASVYNLREDVHYENEAIEPKGLSPYGRSKYLSEQIIKNEFSQRDALILRPRALYGKGDRVLLPRLFKMYKDGHFKVPGNMEYKASMTNVGFLAQVLCNFIDVGFSGQETYNVVDFHLYNLKDNWTLLFSKLFKREVGIRSMNETYVRIIAGMRQILIPGNIFTQTSIDYLTRDHEISFKKLQSTFPNLDSPHFHDYADDYVTWINNIGVATIAAQADPRIVWM